MRPEPRARGLLAAILLLGVLLSALWPAARLWLGVTDMGIWFADSYAVLAAIDATNLGYDIEQSNALDLLSRPHVYSDWWLALGWLGLSRDDNFLVGGTWVLAFLVATWLTLRPRGTAEAVGFSLLAVSPPVLLAINRANNDLVIFALLALSGWAMTCRPKRGWLGTLAGIVVATGLKIYPAVAVLVFLLLRSPRARMVAGLAAALAITIVFASIAPAIARASVPAPETIHTFGAAILLGKLGWDGLQATVIGIVIIAVGAALLVRLGLVPGLADPSPPEDRRVWFVLGAALLVGCFVAGMSYAYRVIFGLWLAPWLWLEMRQTAGFRRLGAQLGGWLLLALMWGDGLFCLFVNATMTPLSEERLQRLNHLWHWISQPFVWMLMMLLAGWLLVLVRETLQRSRPSA